MFGLFSITKVQASTVAGRDLNAVTLVVGSGLSWMLAFNTVRWFRV